MKKRCNRGKSCGSACIARTRSCKIDLARGQTSNLTRAKELIDRMSKAYDKNRGKFENSSMKEDYSTWKPLAKGNYGEVKINPQGTRVVKTLLTHNGKKGEFGEHEIEIAKKMGELGHSPRIHSYSSDHIEMDVAKGKTLWKDYRRGDDEPQMNAQQATKAAAAIRDLHKMGFAHGDLHSLQFLVNGNDVKLVDFGLSVPTSRQPGRVMQDIAKIGDLVNWRNSELTGNPYVQLVTKHLDRYNEVKGDSKAAKNKRIQIAEDYLKELKLL